MAAGEVAERFPRLAVSQVTLQHFLERRLELLKGNSLKHLATDGLVVAKAAADEYVIAFDRFAGELHLGTEQADVAQVMLGAGIRAAGQVDIDRLLEFDACTR